MRVVIPMSGEGARFRQAGYEKIKPLIEIGGKPIIQHLLESFPLEWPKTFICSEEQVGVTGLVSEHNSSELIRALRKSAPASTIIGIPRHKKGPVWAMLEGLRLSPDSFPENEPVLINYCDFAFSWNPLEFARFTEETKCDGAILCYTGFHPEYIRPTLYAYCREEKGRLLEIKEKGHFTPDRTKEFASSGSYYFKSVGLVKKYFTELMEKGLLINGEGYVSLAYAPMLRNGVDVRVFEIPYFLQFGTPEDVQDYEYWAEVFSHFPTNTATLEEMKTTSRPFQLLMPMAGRGSRFEGETPKPLLPVLGRPMFVAAQDYLPATTKQVFVVRKEFTDIVHSSIPQKSQLTSQLIEIGGVTEGQAITCEIGAQALDPHLPVLVSSCDHGMLWNPVAWNDLLDENPDVIVWGQRNYPGASCTPKAFAYIQTASGPLPNDIEKVFVKEPFSQNPRKDLLLVGTFYFKSPKLMTDVIDELKEKNIRVNNEFYLDSVVNLCIQRKLKVKVFEARGYLCWGTPASLLEFNYWHSYFSQKRPS